MQDGKINVDNNSHPLSYDAGTTCNYTAADSDGDNVIPEQPVDNTLDGATPCNPKQPVRFNFFGKYILLVVITTCVVSFFSYKISKIRLDRLQMQEEKQRLEKQISTLESQNSMLERDFSALKEDPVRIEKEARESLGFVGPGEITYERYNFRIKSIKKGETSQVVPENQWKKFFFEGKFPWQFPALIILFSAAYYLVTYYYEYRKLHRQDY